MNVDDIARLLMSKDATQRVANLSAADAIAAAIQIAANLPALMRMLMATNDEAGAALAARAEAQVVIFNQRMEALGRSMSDMSNLVAEATVILEAAKEDQP